MAERKLIPVQNGGAEFDELAAAVYHAGRGRKKGEGWPAQCQNCQFPIGLAVKKTKDGKIEQRARVSWRTPSGNFIVICAACNAGCIKKTDFYARLWRDGVLNDGTHV